jgi:hypothetical protein
MEMAVPPAAGSTASAAAACASLRTSTARSTATA